MIINNISTIIGKRRYTVAETARIANLKYETVQKLYLDKTKRIDIKTMDRLCFALECTPNDLFKYIED